MVDLGNVWMVHLQVQGQFLLCEVNGEFRLGNLLFLDSLDYNVLKTTCGLDAKTGYLTYSVFLEIFRLRQVDHCRLLSTDQLTWLAWFVHGVDKLEFCWTVSEIYRTLLENICGH